MMAAVTGLVVLIGFQHFMFMLIETYFWTKPLGLKIFKQNLEKAQASKVLASNQGLYNGFLGAGLFWSALHPDSDFSQQLMTFFLTCVVMAGVWGGFTFSKRILWVQALPAMLAMIFLILI